MVLKQRERVHVIGRGGSLAPGRAVGFEDRSKTILSLLRTAPRSLLPINKINFNQNKDHL